MSGVNESAKLERLTVKLAAARELARIVFVREVDLGEIADAAAVSESMPSRWASKRCGDAMSLADVVLIGRKLPGVGHDLLRWAGAELGLVVSKKISGAKIEDRLAHAARLTKELGEALVAYSECMGALTDEKIAGLDRECREAEEAIASLRDWIDEERSARAVPTLRAKGRAA